MPLNGNHNVPRMLNNPTYSSQEEEAQYESINNYQRHLTGWGGSIKEIPETPPNLPPPRAVSPMPPQSSCQPTTAPEREDEYIQMSATHHHIPQSPRYIQAPGTGPVTGPGGTVPGTGPGTGPPTNRIRNVDLVDETDIPSNYSAIRDGQFTAQINPMFNGSYYGNYDTTV